MEKILIFAGTTEGRELAEFAGGLKVQALVSVATEYGKTCLDDCDNIQTFVGHAHACGEYLTAEKIRKK